MAIHIRVARTPRDLEAVYALRARARQELSGSRDGDGGQRVDRFDTFSSTTNILITDEATPIGTFRIAEETEAGLPGDTFNDFSPIRGYLTGRTLGIDSLSILRQYRSRPGILIAAMKVALHVMQARQARHILLLAPRELAPFLEEVGLSAIGPAEWSDDAQAWLTPLYGLITSLRLQSIEWRQDPAIDILGEALHRSIFSRGEEICRQGEPGDCAYVVARGSVSVTVNAAGGSEVLLGILGPGELIGELALLDPGPRSATVRAYAQETDLITMERGVFRSAVFGDASRTEAMLRLLARRVRSSAAQMASLAPVDCRPQVVRLLRDAARTQSLGDGRLAGVTLEWIAGQVGRLPSVIERVLAELEAEMLLRCDEGIGVVDVARLEALVVDPLPEGGTAREVPIFGRPGPGDDSERGRSAWRSGLEHLS